MEPTNYILGGTDPVEVRAGPGPGYALLGVLQPGDAVAAYGYQTPTIGDVPGWRMIAYGGGIGWILPCPLTEAFGGD